MREIYLLTQNVNTGYDTFNSMVVIADSKDAAKQISLNYCQYNKHDTWVSDHNQLTVSVIGVPLATQPNGIVLASFNAG